MKLAGTQFGPGTDSGIMVAFKIVGLNSTGHACHVSRYLLGPSPDIACMTHEALLCRVHLKLVTLQAGCLQLSEQTLYDCDLMVTRLKVNWWRSSGALTHT